MASVADAEMIAALSSSTFYDTYYLYNTPENISLYIEEYFTIEKVTAEIIDTNNTFILAFQQDECVGYVKLCEENFLKELKGISAIEIARLYSKKNLIGKGVGRTLMLSSFDIAMQRNKQIIWLAVWEENQRAIDFYHKAGFKKFSEQEFVFGKEVQNDWLMKKVVF